MQYSSSTCHMELEKVPRRWRQNMAQYSSTCHMKLEKAPRRWRQNMQYSSTCHMKLEKAPRRWRQNMMQRNYYIIGQLLLVVLGIWAIAAAKPGHAATSFEVDVLINDIKPAIDPSGQLLQSWTLAAGGNPCAGSFQGVTCNSVGSVANISLQSCSLSGSIPSQFDLLSSLQVLEICCNNLTGSIPESLGSLNLTSLDVHNNSLSGHIPTGLILQQLQYGSLDFNYGNNSGLCMMSAAAATAALPLCNLSDDDQPTTSQAAPAAADNDDVHNYERSKSRLKIVASIFMAVFIAMLASTVIILLFVWARSRKRRDSRISDGSHAATAAQIPSSSCPKDQLLQDLHMMICTQELYQAAASADHHITELKHDQSQEYQASAEGVPNFSNSHHITELKHDQSQEYQASAEGVPNFSNSLAGTAAADHITELKLDQSNIMSSTTTSKRFFRSFRSCSTRGSTVQSSSSSSCTSGSYSTISDLMNYSRLLQLATFAAATLAENDGKKPESSILASASFGALSEQEYNNLLLLSPRLLLLPAVPAIINISPEQLHNNFGYSWISLNELEIATNYFSSQRKLLPVRESESDSNSPRAAAVYYRGTLPSDGSAVAVKCLYNTRFWFQAGMKDLRFFIHSRLAHLSHANLVHFKGFCVAKGGSECFLVYHFVAGDSLEQRLHGGGGHHQNNNNNHHHSISPEFHLDWPMRVKIINDVAKGLQYLHEGGKQAIVHQNLWAGNILLSDKDGTALLSDYGLNDIIAEEDMYSSQKSLASLGYLAPEYGHMVRLNDKSEVYSFGALSLEILTGRRPVIVDGKNRSTFISTYTWVKTLLQSAGPNTDEIIDPRLGSLYPATEAAALLNIALSCMVENPCDRPTMGNVVKKLNACDETLSS